MLKNVNSLDLTDYSRIRSKYLYDCITMKDLLFRLF